MQNKKIIFDVYRHNCSFCGTKSAAYKIKQIAKIDVSANKCLYMLFLECQTCKKIVAHLIKNIHSNKDVWSPIVMNHKGEPCNVLGSPIFTQEEISQFNSNIILSIPTPTTIIDKEIPPKLRDLLIEALKCINENALTGASACIRKAIYEFLKKENSTKDCYDDKIRKLKKSYPVLKDYLDILIGIKGITSDQVHEDSFTSFDSNEAYTYVSILEEIFKEVYVLPKQRSERKNAILNKFYRADNAKKAKRQEQDR